MRNFYVTFQGENSLEIEYIREDGNPDADIKNAWVFNSKKKAEAFKERCEKVYKRFHIEGDLSVSEIDLEKMKEE